MPATVRRSRLRCRLNGRYGVGEHVVAKASRKNLALRASDRTIPLPEGKALAERLLLVCVSVISRGERCRPHWQQAEFGYRYVR